MRRYPMADLLEATGLTESGLTRAAGLSGSTLVKAREIGFTADAADRYASRCGFHPTEVWPDYGLVHCVECEGLFAPVRKGHMFCTKACGHRQRDRERFRARYQSDPEFAEANRLRLQQYRREAARAIRAKKAAHYQANKPEIEAKRRERRARARAERSEEAA